MNNETYSALAALGCDSACGVLIDASVCGKDLGMAVDCEMPKEALRAAQALASDPEFPNALRSYGSCMVKAITLRLEGATGHAATQERRADAFYAQLPRSFQW